MYLFLLGLLGGIFLLGSFLGWVLTLVWWILTIVAGWMVFTKAGEAGWKSIIPIYGDYVLYKICWDPKFFWVNLGLSILRRLLVWIGGGDPFILIRLLLALVNVALFAVSLLLFYKLARSFGKGLGFTAGLYFFQPVFMMILGFGSARYYGPDLP